jgi:hypothetical protein
MSSGLGMGVTPRLPSECLPRLLSTINANNPAEKYIRHNGIANNVIVIGSGVGVKAAVNRKQENTAIRQGRRIDLPESIPNKFKATKKSGRIKANPKIRINLRTKSRYSSNLTKLSKLSGVNPNKISTACGKIR